MVSFPRWRLWKGWPSLQIDQKMLCQMFKGSVPVAISLGFYQSTAVSEVYTSLGFLVSIIAVVTVNVLPRAKLIETTFNICLFTAIAIPITMLSTWSGIQARQHTDPQNLYKYNSSQSAVTGIWLFANILVSNTLQARYPALLIPTILYNIFVIVQYTSCSRFHTWIQCWDLIYLTARCYYTGVAISFVSGMLIYPVTCRTEIFEVQETFLHAVRDMLTSAGGFVHTLQDNPTFPRERLDGTSHNGLELRRRMIEVKKTYVKMHEELSMAKREIAWGKLTAKDIGYVSDLCRRILMPLSGLGHLPDILGRVQEIGGWHPYDFESEVETSNAGLESSARMDYSHEHDMVWQHCINILLDSANSTNELMKDGLEHAGLQLEIVPRPGANKLFGFIPRLSKSKETDIESDGQTIRPGGSRFSETLEQGLGHFMERRVDALNAWANSEGRTSSTSDEMTSQGRCDFDGQVRSVHLHRDRQQLYLILYIQHMIHSIGLAVLDLSKFSDDLVNKGTMSRNRLIIPSTRRIWNWFLSTYDTTNTPIPDDDRSSSKNETHMLWCTANQISRDIEHLPPRNAYERLGLRVRRFQTILQGPELSFGFRSACATMSCAILAYLHQTQEIFTHYRLIWSVIIAAIGGNMSAGQSGVSYVLRILGSFAALIICYAVWYIPNGEVPGVIVIMWFVAFLQMYFLLRWPQYIIGWLVIFITEVLTIGYELQVAKIGVAAAESGGIYVFPPYYVAALRVACVLWGTCASIFFTYLPYPITARGLLRTQISVIMELLANYHAVVHATIRSRLRGTEGDANNKHSHGHILSHTRKAMFNKIIYLDSRAIHNIYLQKYEPSLGGRFPVVTFQKILSHLMLIQIPRNSLLEYVSLLSHATQAWSTNTSDAAQLYHTCDRKWLEDLSKLIGPLNATVESSTSVLCQLSATISTGRSLPPRIELPKAYHLSEKLRGLDPDILSTLYMKEAGYSAFAVMEILSNMITSDLEVLVVEIETLVGVIDFTKLDSDHTRKSQ
ncbi:uncharacterized protein CC84DRAFT_1106215 [Paraphaeosphaeria sporulosa]|uniref:Uncharacterized protein n=1 Tax=Paraphaeosphaeria sporulosa TaxID=1460663 RepID=A0A177BVV9_9PLEO|nr:uncharacterized protein CC84DRAFT_1106215 [Paraphaeosphaeria sporulosa]OAF98496.1 hypothetical protein CC84DRAFT_1106215 [Paraphaeosphaeria sporulosa]